MSQSSELVLKPLSEAEFPRTWAVLRSGLAEGVAPGMVAGFWSRKIPEQIEVTHLGSRRVVPSAQPMEPETVFDLASVTKVMGTSTLAALLVERRWLRWDTRLDSVLPGYPFKNIELRHLLSHTAGFIAWRPFYEELRAHFGTDELWRLPVSERQAAMKRIVTSVAPDVAPGERTLYSDVCFLLAGYLLEEVTQLPLDRAVTELLWRPLGLSGAFYRRIDQSAENARDERVAATEDCPWRRGVLQGQVHDDNTWAMGGYAGHAGAFGSVRDVLQFARRMLSGFLSPEVLRGAWTRVDSPAGCERTPGWDTPSAAGSSTGQYFSPRSVGHLGFTGTSLWLDPDAGLAVTLLTNRVHPTRENNRIRAFRPLFHDAIRQDLALRS